MLVALALGALGACGRGDGKGASSDRTRVSTSTRVAAAGGDTAALPQDNRGRGGEASAAPPTVLFIGTSLTAGLGLDPDSAYPAIIQRKIDSLGLGFRVVNAGVSGETSADALRRIGWLMRAPASVIVLETGANDGLRGLDPDSTEANIQQIIDSVHADQPDAALLLVQMEALPNFGMRYTTAFHDMYPQLARRNGLTLVPFLLAGVAGNPALNQADGVHPNNRGEKIVAANVWRALRPVLERVRARHATFRSPPRPDARRGAPGAAG